MTSSIRQQYYNILKYNKMRLVELDYICEVLHLPKLLAVLQIPLRSSEIKAILSMIGVRLHSIYALFGMWIKDEETENALCRKFEQVLDPLVSLRIIKEYSLVMDSECYLTLYFTVENSFTAYYIKFDEKGVQEVNCNNQ